MRFVLRTTTLVVFSSSALLRCHFSPFRALHEKKHWPSGGPGTKGTEKENEPKRHINIRTIGTEGKGSFGQDGDARSSATERYDAMPGREHHLLAPV